MPSRILISIIDELFDELHGASIFSKFDLKFSYHQIHMKSSDILKITFQAYLGYYEL